MARPLFVLAALSALLLAPAAGAAQEDREARRAAYDGSAVVTLEQAEYTIVILCNDPVRPELGFRTEPNRVTRERTGGRRNMIGLVLRPWKETGDVVINLDKYVAWLPRPTSTAGKLSMELDMSPASVVRDQTPVLLTYDMWQSGDRPPGRTGVRFEATCGKRDPAAPSYRKVTGSSGLGGGGHD